MIQELVDAIWAKFTGLFSWFSWIPEWFFLAEWYVLGLGILAVCLVLSWFFGGLPIIGKWIRGLGGVVVLGYGLFLAGMTVMFNYMRRKDHDDI